MVELYSRVVCKSLELPGLGNQSCCGHSGARVSGGPLSVAVTINHIFSTIEQGCGKKAGHFLLQPPRLSGWH